MLKPCLLALLVGLTACPPASLGPTPAPKRVAPAPPRPYRFSLDGKPFQPELISPEGDGARPGDLVAVGDLLLTLGEEHDLRMIARRDEGRVTRLYLDLGGGKKQLVAARVGSSYRGKEKIVDDPLRGLPAAELAGLRGLAVDEWPAELERELQAVDATRLAITLGDGVAGARGHRLPVLPAGLRHLRINDDSIRDYSTLAGLRRLYYLEVSTLSRAPLDASLLVGMSDLRFLDLSGNELRNPASLGKLRQLRVLKLGHATGLGELEAARELRTLRALVLHRTAIKDLTVLDGLPDLEEVDADLSKVRRLPRVPLPRLRRIRLLSAPVTAAEVEEFARANPRCEVVHRWADTLRKYLGVATRLRARTGGTCHRRPDQEKTLFEVKGSGEVATFLDRVEIAESRSGFHCMCCGAPSFELYQGAKLLGTIGFHHGRSLRWPGGWPADGMLTDASAEKIVAWLADQGVAEPKKELLIEKKHLEAAARRRDRRGQLLPPAVLPALAAARDEKQITAALVEGVPDERERVTVYLRLFGADGGSWNRRDGLDDILSRSLLPAVSKEVLARVIAGLPAADAAARTGAQRWLFGEARWRDLPPAALEKLVPVLAPAALTHPRPINRSRTITALGKLGSPAARRLLRELVSGKLPARPLVDDEHAEAGGSIFFTGEDAEVGEGVSDRAHAALALARTRDRTGQRAIRALLGGASAADRPVVQLALDILAGKQPASQPAPGPE